MTIVTDRGFGTVCATLIALPSMATPEVQPIFLFAPGRPGDTTFEEVEMGVIGGET